MMNVMTTEAREKLSWINEPHNWSYTDQGGLIIEAQADSDFSKTRQASIFERPHHSCRCPWLVISK